MKPDPQANQHEGFNKDAHAKVWWFDSTAGLQGWWWTSTVYWGDRSHGPFPTSRDALLDAIRVRTTTKQETSDGT